MAIGRETMTCGRAVSLATAICTALAVAGPARSQETPLPEPDIIPVTPEPVGPVVDEGYKLMVRPALWLGILNTSFSKAPGAAHVSLEDTFDASKFQAVFPIEICARTDAAEFRFRYMFWNEKATHGFTGDFGSIPAGPAVPYEAKLNTDVLGIDMLYRILDRDSFDLFISTGADLVSTEFSLSGAGGADSIDETIPIITVGLGLRFRLKEDISFSLSSSALSYSQLLGLDEEFFGVKDTYRNIELSLQWDLYNDANWGVGYKQYDVGFQSSRLSTSQSLKGVAVWYSRRF